MKKDSPLAFLIDVILTLLPLMLIVAAFELDFSILIGASIGVVLIWLNAWRFSRRKQVKA